MNREIMKFRAYILKATFCILGSMNIYCAESTDKYLWLEDVESIEALDWVHAKNDKTLKKLESDPLFSTLKEQATQIFTSKDKLITPSIRGEFLYDFWQDTTNVQGLWRRTTLEEFKKPSPKWEIILDLDLLSSTEGQKWVWHGADCLGPDFNRCLLSLSPGGSDASEVREFDITSKTFVTDGFRIPVAKSYYAWADQNTLLVGTNFGEGSLTSSGYPMIIKKWTRGTALESAIEIFRGEQNDMLVAPFSQYEKDGYRVFLSRKITFFTEETFLYSNLGFQKIHFPLSCDFKGLFKNQLLGLLREDWVLEKRTLLSGSLISLPLAKMSTPRNTENYTEVVYSPNDRSALESITITKDAMYLSLLENISSKLYRATFHVKTTKDPKVLIKQHIKWKIAELNYPKMGSIGLVSASDSSDLILTTYENMITPKTLYMQNLSKNGHRTLPQALKQSPAFFDASQMEVLQLEAISSDKTKIPYFIMKPKTVALDYKNPTLLYGYGGFEVSMTPNYRASWGKLWVEKGGIAVIANIRGGGEFGPKWHEAARKENRQKAFDDFFAVAEDLILKGYTSPRHLGIMGGSNGGLLMGVSLTQRPDLFEAVVCQVPLLDMMRYNKLLAGASWMDEYGNPDKPEEASYILKYSPYQNLKPDEKYPHTFFVTSTKDDRVHPGHARKMAAKMEELGNTIDYYENTNGGHSASSDLGELARRVALEMTFLWEKL